jgi:hypothetical protein
MSPFEFVNSINDTKVDIMVDDQAEKAYNSFMVNRSLSYFPDTILLANEVNRNPHIGNRLKYNFLMNAVRKRKRFSKWGKAESVPDLELVKKRYGYSSEKARSALSILTEEQLRVLRAAAYTGGSQPPSSSS